MVLSGVGLLRDAWTDHRVRALALTVALIVLYQGSLDGEFLNIDDDWLIERNRALDYPLGRALAAFFTDFSFDTRYMLGAEYLPLRDLSVWLDVAAFGRFAAAMRTVQLALYIVAALGFRLAFVRTFGSVAGEWLAWFFALHPVHLESVAWLAGRKDVLALCFMGVALWRHAEGKRDARLSVPALWLCACLSKSMSIGFVGPLLATDLWLRRRPDAILYAASAALVGAATAVHVHVGGLMGMVSGPLAGSRAEAVFTMGPIWLRYLRMVADPSILSMRHDVTILAAPTAASVFGWVVMVGGGAVALWTWRRGHRLPLAAWIWFAVPLGPVSQVLVPLQNVIADRYMWLSVAGPLLLLAHVDTAARARWARPLLLALVLIWSGTTAARAPLFRTSVSLFDEAASKTVHDPVAPFHVATGLVARGEPSHALIWYLLTLDRCEPADPIFAQASNGMAALLAKRGRLLEAERILERALAAQPENPKVRSNLAKVRQSLAAGRAATRDGRPAQGAGP